MTDERWFPIQELSNEYAISTYGRVKNINTLRILKTRITKKGYEEIKIKGKNFKIHRLVALTFISRHTAERNQINHIDEDKTNNHVENLEWVTAKENSNWGTRNKRRVKNTDYKKIVRTDGYIHRLDGKDWSNVNADKRLPVLATNLKDGKVNKFVSLREASRQLGVTCGKISECVNGKRKTANGYKFKLIN